MSHSPSPMRRRPSCGSSSRREADRLEAEAVEREGPSDRQQRDVTGGGRAVVQLDDVGAQRARTGPCSQRPDPQPNRHAVALEGSQRRLRVPWVIGRGKPRAGLHDGDRNPEPGVDLGQLDAGGPTAEHEQALRQPPSRGGVPIGPCPDGLDPGHRRDLRRRPDGDDDFGRLERAHAARGIRRATGQRGRDRRPGPGRRAAPSRGWPSRPRPPSPSRARCHRDSRARCG